MTASRSTTATGAACLVELLEQLDVKLAFGLPGVHNLPIWRALAGSSVRLVGVRHEQTAVYAADGYARATGELGVALVTTGPGAANTLGATGEAMASSSPMLIVATDVATSVRRPGVYRGSLHETRDQTAMFRPVTKLARAVATAEELPSAVLECGRVAVSAPSGPVYLGIPNDLLLQAVGVDRLAPPSPVPGPSSQREIEAASRLVSEAERPLIWAGGGAARADAGALVGELALRLAAPVITTYASRGLIAPEHPCFVPGPAHAQQVGALWDEADVVLAIGTDFDGVMTQNWLMPQPPALISVNVEPADANKNYRSDVVLVGDARAVLERLVPTVRAREGLDQLQARLAAIGREIAEWIRADEPQAAWLLQIVERVLPPEAIVVADMCIPGYWLGGYWRVPRPRKLAYPVGWGTLGFAFPASLGAALAQTGPTVCVVGDGGFMYACGELATAVEADVPLTIVLVDDRGYGMLRFDQELAGEESFGVDLVTPDFEVFAQSFGVGAVTVDGFGPEFEDALRDSLDSRGTQMIVVRAALKPPPTTSPRWYRAVHP